MVLSRREHTVQHDLFSNIGRYLRSGDVLVANRSRVLPARIAARKSSGGRIEFLLLRSLGNSTWMALARPSRKLREGTTLLVESTSLEATLVRKLDDGLWEVAFRGPGDVERSIASAGKIPLPPYITNPDAPADRYQTVYADRDGSVAAPTAGLHFTESLLQSLRESGIEVVYLTLHVGLGTFQPVKVENVREHTMHSEWGEIPPDVACAINQARSDHRRIVAVGTTSVRLLESATVDGMTRPFQGETNIFLYPGKAIRSVDALITNFHLPRSTLLMLVSAFAGREFVLSAYTEAIARKYRFYSFGDAMLIE